MLTLYKRTLLVKIIRNFFAAFRADSRIVKKTKSGLTHPRLIQGWQKNFWDILLLWKNPCSGSGEIYMFVADRDRQTNELLPYMGGQDFSTVWKKYLPYSLQKFCFARLLRLQGDKVICWYLCFNTVFIIF